MTRRKIREGLDTFFMIEIGNYKTFEFNGQNHIIVKTK